MLRSSLLVLLLCICGIFAQTFPVYHESAIKPTLMSFYTALDGPGWHNKTNWATDAPCCEWFGVKCNEERFIVELNLHNNLLNGQMKFSIGQIRSLTRLDLSDNALLGKIPPTLSQLSNLTFLDLSDNSLSESIPDAFGDFISLQHLDLSNNDFTGDIPETLGKLPQVRYLDLSGNQIEGEIPTTLGDLANVELLNLSRNALTGWIPASFDMYTPKLHTLDLSRNQLNGFLNGSIASVPNLKFLDISHNQVKALYKYNFSGLEHCDFSENPWLCPLDDEDAEHHCHAECHRHSGQIPGVAVFSVLCLFGALAASIVYVTLIEKERIKKESGVIDEDDEF